MSPEVAPEVVVDGRYRLLERVGSGGMADVWAADDLQLGRKVALKLLYRRFSQDPEFVERFRREASSAAALQHPNVVSVYDRGEWEGTYYIAMEFLEGPTLKQLLIAEGALDPARAIEIAIQILKASRFAHGRGVIHRDIKPHNVIVEPVEDRVKVTDFGIARAGASDMTETGSIMGTALYLSPEQAQGHAVSAASDLYAVGVVLWEMLTGMPPFSGDSAVTVALKQVTEAPLAPSVHNPAVGPELDAVVMRALEKDPARRYVDADEFIAALQAAREGLLDPAGATAAWAVPPAAPPAGLLAVPGAVPAGAVPAAGPVTGRRRRWPWILLAVLVLIGLVAGIYTLTRPALLAVPRVVGISLGNASAVLQNDGFKAAVTRVKDPAPVDQVIRQDPLPQTKASHGATVQLTVSNGPGDVAVPPVAGKSRASAERALRQFGLVAQVVSESSASVPAGQATRTEPAAGTSLPAGSTVSLFVSSGAAQVTVPRVVGDTEAAARSSLESAGLKVDAISRQSSDSTPGSVTDESPGSGTTVAQGATVTITIAQAPPTAPSAAIPSVIGDSVDQARQAITAAGLTPVVTMEPVSDQSRDGIVLHQSTGQRPTGSQVKLVVGKYTPKGPTGASGPASP